MFFVANILGAIVSIVIGWIVPEEQQYAPGPGEEGMYSDFKKINEYYRNEQECIK